MAAIPQGNQAGGQPLPIVIREGKLDKAKRVVKKYGPGGALCALGIGIMAIPIPPAPQIVGGLVFASGAGAIGQGACNDDDHLRRREAVTRANAAAVAVLQTENANLSSENSTLRESNQQLQLQLGELQEITTELDEGVTQYLAGLKDGEEEAAASRDEFDGLLGRFGELIDTLEGPLADMAANFQGAIEQTLEFAAAEKRLIEASRELVTVEGRLEGATAAYQEQVESLRTEVANLRTEREQLSTTREALQRDIQEFRAQLRKGIEQA